MNIRVRSGDTFWYYSRLFNMPLALIEDSNPGAAPAALQIGQLVRIPGYYVTFYTIRPGDTLWAIAQQRGINVDMIFLVNPGLNPYALQIGQTINLPVKVTWPVTERRKNYDFAALLSDVMQLTEIYPFVRLRSAGRSVMGKDLYELQIGRGAKKVHMNASFHANEWLTSPVLMEELDTYLRALTTGEPVRGLNVRPFYNTVMLSVMPMVNPDGVDLVINGAPAEEPYRSDVLAINGGSTNFSGWKANIRGVDLNNQYPAKWEEEAARKPDRPAPRDYPGEGPLTEPESVAVAELVRRSDFNRVLAYHTQGKVIFWGFEGLEPPESETLVNEYARVSGYVPIRYTDSFAGFKDWFIQDWRRPGFTLELGRGVNPLPVGQFNEIYEENLGIFLANLYM